MTIRKLLGASIIFGTLIAFRKEVIRRLIALTGTNVRSERL